MKQVRTLALLSALLIASCNPEADSPVLTIGVVTDLHYCRGREPAKDRYYSLSTEKLSEAVSYFNGQKVDFTVSLGDTFDPDMSSYQDVAGIFANLNNPVYKILGNHDIIAPYGMPRQDSVMVAMGISSPYFSIRTGKGIRCIFIDSNDISFQSTATGSVGRETAQCMLTSLKTAGLPMAAKYNGMLSDRQKKWLEAEIEAAEKAGESVLVFSHMPLMPRNIKAAEWDGEQIDSLLQAHANVKAVFAGHHHEGAYFESGHILHYTFKGMVSGTQNHYGLIRVFKDHIEVEELS